MKTFFNNLSNTSIAAVGCVLLVSGCGAEDEPEAEIPVGDFVIGTQLATPDGSQNFVAFADQVDDSNMLTLDQALEAGSAGGVFAPADGDGVFFTAEEGGILQRWRANADDRTVVRDGMLDFSAEGLTSFFPTATHIQFIDDTKAYLMNSAFGEIIVWNPSDLEVLETIEVPEIETDIDGAAGSFSLSGVRTGSRLMFTYNYFRDTSSFTPESYLVVIDTTDDTILVDHSSECGDLTYGVEAENGDVYWASSFFNAALHHVDEDAAPAPCLLRVPNGTAEFMNTDVTLTALAGGRPAGNIVHAGGNHALMRVYHDELAPVESDADATALVIAPAWRWWLLDLENLEAEELSDSTAGTGQTIYYQIGSDSYVITLAPDYSTTTFERVVPDEAPIPGLTVPGTARFGLVKIF